MRNSPRQKIPPPAPPALMSNPALLVDRRAGVAGSAAVPAASCGGVSPPAATRAGTPPELAGEDACATPISNAPGFNARSFVSKSYYPDNPRISNIMRSYNEGWALRETLPALRAQDYKN